jgi:glycosyltransferase involved in cell wall biosynthesis
VICIIVISCALDSTLLQSKMQGTLKPHMERYRLFSNFDQVTILTQDTQEFLDELGKVQHIPCASSRSKIVRNVLQRMALLRWLYFSQYSFMWLLRNRANIKLIISENVDSPTPLLFSSITKTPLYIHYHYDVATQVSQVNKREIRGLMVLLMERLVFKKAAGIWVTAQSLGEKAKAFGAKKVTLLPNWIDFNQKQNQIPPKIQKSAPQIVFVGRLHPVKRVPLLLEAFAQLKDTYPNVLLKIVGDGPERLNLLNLAQNLKISDSVNFMGFQSHEKVLQIMKQSDLIVLPSKMEGNPRVLVEAMMLKVPIIAANVIGVKDIIKHGQTGHLITQESPQELAKDISYVLTNKEYAVKIAENAYEFAKQNFSKEQALKRIGEDISSIVPSYLTKTLTKSPISTTT